MFPNRIRSADSFTNPASATKERGRQAQTSGSVLLRQLSHISTKTITTQTLRQKVLTRLTYRYVSGITLPGPSNGPQTGVTSSSFSDFSDNAPVVFLS